MSRYLSPYTFQLGDTVERQTDGERGYVVEVRTLYAVIHIAGDTIEVDQFDRAFMVLERHPMDGDRYDSDYGEPPDEIYDSILYDALDGEEAVRDAEENAREQWLEEQDHPLDWLDLHVHAQLQRDIDNILFQARS